LIHKVAFAPEQFWLPTNLAIALSPNT